ncbi:MAG TPA: sugar ABC transporter substrate-binding protein, partial [Pseudomonas sp.]|nr:sugar ABC transporter substrate-binding protein [Pseudomonas sp.]
MSGVTQAERRDITRAAARWLALLDAEDCSEDDRVRLALWRSSNPE